MTKWLNVKRRRAVRILVPTVLAAAVAVGLLPAPLLDPLRAVGSALLALL